MYNGTSLLRSVALIGRWPYYRVVLFFFTKDNNLGASKGGRNAMVSVLLR